MTALNNIKQQLTTLKPFLLQNYPIQSIGLFGSIVRNDYQPESDIDIIIDFNAPIGIEFIDIANWLENQLHKPIDLVSKNGIKENYFKSIQSEIVYL